MKHLMITLCALLLLAQGAFSQTNDVIARHEIPDSFVITVEMNPSTNEKFIRYSGDIDSLSGLALSTVISQHRDASYLELNSIGGMLHEINGPMEKITEFALPIVVKTGEMCVSACAYMALASPDIRIHGILAFHLPFIMPSQMQTMTPHMISKTNVHTTIMMAKTMFGQGWRFLLYYLIEQRTDPNTFVVFTDSESLNQFRFTDPAEFMDNVNVELAVAVMTGEQIKQHSIAQTINNSK